MGESERTEGELGERFPRWSRGRLRRVASGDLIELMFAGDPLVTISDVPDPVRESHPLVRHQANNLEKAYARLPVLSDIRAVKDLFADGEFGLWHCPNMPRQFLD